VNTQTSGALLGIDPDKFRQSFDREPIGFSHSLSELDLFKLASLHALAEKMADHPKDYSVVEGARAADTKFFSVPHVALNAHQAIENLHTGAYRILIKRAENHDRKFKELIQGLFQEIVDVVEGLGREKIVRLESGILITSAHTITPFHFDPEIGCFSQIEGEKMYHVFSPSVIAEGELERFAICGPVALAPVDLNGRDSMREHVFHLTAGKGFHQPHHAPHWVETGESRSISYTFVFETESSRITARTRAFNYYLRKSGLKPAVLGARPELDTFKAETMRALIPVRQLTAKMVNKVRFA
jgi:hypothetical protein